MVNPGYSLFYDGKRVSESTGTLCVECRSTDYEAYDASEWVLRYTNTGKTQSGLMEKLFDCDIDLPLKAEPPRPTPGRRCTTENTAAIFTGNGCIPGGQYSYEDDLSATEFREVRHFIRCGGRFSVSNDGQGRSSDGTMPFADVNFGDDGYILAIGWTGSWFADFERKEESIRISAGIQGLRFRLQPGESVRTASILVLEYHDGRINAHNRFRRLMKNVYARFGKDERPQDPPLAFESFGGMPTAMMLDHLNALSAHGIHFDHHWIDAGWQGDSVQNCSNCYTGDWAAHTGQWFINTNYHPNALADVVACGEKAGMGLLLWFEPERMLACSPVCRDHPDWFLECGEDKANMNRSILLDLGNPEAWQGVYDMLCGFIEKLHIRVYRQDFNFDPMPFWKYNDQSEREGIKQLRYIEGLYRLWDALLERFPYLIIDDCASGGRRIDIETVRRAFPFFRSDYYCNFNAEPDVCQSQHSGIANYLPYSGCMTKVKPEKYAARSSYSAAFGINCWCADFQTMTEEDFLTLREIIDEYRGIRHFFSCDYYPISVPQNDPAAWTIWQYHDPDTDEGIVMAFRHVASPLRTADIELQGLCADSAYEWTCLDNGITETHTDCCVTVEIPQKRTSRIFRYKKKG